VKHKPLLIAAVLGLGFGGLLYGPSRIDPVAWTPSTPLEIPPNEDLRSLTALPLAQAEDLAVDAQGRIYGGTPDGRIVRLLPDGTVEDFAVTGGRALGLAWHPDGRLIVADCFQGLLAVSADGRTVEVLATEADGVPFKFTDDVDVAADGRIFFSDASDAFAQPDYMMDLFEGRPHGRLLMHHEGKTTVLLDGLHFANGVAVAPDQSYVLVTETWRYRVTRYWLTGDKAGTSEPFIEGLPGFPDGISSDGRGTFWLAVFSPRKAIGEWLAARPRARVAIARLPKDLLPKPIPYGYVIALNGDGEIVATLQDPGGQALHPVTSVERVGDKLYLGSLDADHAGVLDVPEAFLAPLRIAVTIDDLPFVHFAPRGRAAATDQLLEVLTSRDVPATGFVVCDRTEPPHPLLSRWQAAGMELENHHEVHASLNDTPVATYLQGVESCSQELAALTGARTTYFRFPYLANGKTTGSRDKTAEALVRMELTVGRVSVDNHEWKLGELYADALRDHDQERAGAIAAWYVEHLLDAVAHFQDVARRKLGRDIDHILLVHANQLAADHLGEVLDQLAAREVQFITLTEALQDPAYTRPDEYVGSAGISWLYRIAPVDEGRPWDDAAWDEIVARFEGG
jgi:sugar lactone lactonase YvrE/peptidoglycan/xylan/chitin deacetylase (PgdA/CDA1 family)